MGRLFLKDILVNIYRNILLTTSPHTLKVKMDEDMENLVASMSLNL